LIDLIEGFDRELALVYVWIWKGRVNLRSEFEVIIGKNYEERENVLI